MRALGSEFKEHIPERIDDEPAFLLHDVGMGPRVHGVRCHSVAQVFGFFGLGILVKAIPVVNYVGGVFHVLFYI